MPEAEQISTGELEPKMEAPLTADEALTTVLSTFSYYESDRAGHERRWDVHDRLYLGAVQKQFWRNSTVERASLPFLFVFDQIESALASLSASIFYGPDPWFEVEPLGETSVQDARAVEDVLRYVLEVPSPLTEWRDARAEILLAFTSALLYGNGFMLIEWNATEKMPRPRWIDHRDVYIDPACQTPSVDDCRSVVVRMFKTVRQLDELRDTPGMNIPSVEALTELAKLRARASADRSIPNIEAIRKSTSGQSDFMYSVAPEEDAVEVLIYYSKTRIIWVLGRIWVAYNEKNDLGFVPLASMPAYPVPRRFYAQSIADIQEPIQRGIETLFNRHLDEISLRLDPPRIASAVSYLSTHSPMRWFPGMVLQGDPNSIKLLFEGPPLPVFQEISWLVQTGERMTGINSLTSGIPVSSNMARTLGGIRSLSAASSARLARFACHAENYMLAPMLMKMQRMISAYREPTEMIPGLGRDHTSSWVDAGRLSSQAKFVMRVASQMVGRERLMQIFPMIFQTLMSGPVMGELARMGMTVNFLELMRMLQEATGIGRRYEVLRPLSQEEIQRMQSPQMSPDSQVELMKEQIRAQARIQAIREKNRGKQSQPELPPTSGPQEAPPVEMPPTELLE